MVWLNVTEGPHGEPVIPELTDLLAQLLAVPMVRSCSMDPAELTSLPAVWVQLASIPQEGTLTGHPLELRVHLIVADTDGGHRAVAELAALFNAVTPVIEPDGDTTAIPVIMTDGTERPALQVPVTLYTTP